MSLYMPPGATGPALDVVWRECIAANCTKKVRSEVWPGQRAPKKWCPNCKKRMELRDSAAEGV
jgi:hypothetical protein